jgi:hypothetical protein
MKPGSDPVVISVPIDSHSGSIGEYVTLRESDPLIKVQATVRQDDDPEWEVEDSEFKIQIWIDDRDTYISTYFDMDDLMMENGLWRGEKNRITTGAWDMNASSFYRHHR